jgi:hypothetical protein
MLFFADIKGRNRSVHWSLDAVMAVDLGWTFSVEDCLH